MYLLTPCLGCLFLSIVTNCEKTTCIITPNSAILYQTHKASICDFLLAYYKTLIRYDVIFDFFVVLKNRRHRLFYCVFKGQNRPYIYNFQGENNE